MNTDETRETLEYLYQEWLGQLAAKLVKEEMGAKDFLAAGRVIAELAAKFPTKMNEKFQDDDISKMSPEALRQFIASRSQVLPIEAPVEDVKVSEIDETIQSTADLMRKRDK